jgi:hypothetical protein
MSAPTDEQMEDGLRELFGRQADGIDVTERAFDDAPMAAVAELTAERSRRRRIGGGMAAIATVAAVVMLVVSLGGRDARVSTKPPVQGQPTVTSPVWWKTALVTMTADDLAITVDGKTFTARDANVELNSDPGDPAYWTLEADWTEHDVEMRVNMYFESDGRDWWASEIRTYNGKAEGDWITYTGTYFKTPLGTPFAGGLDLREAASNSSLHLGGLRIAVQPKHFDCSRATGPYTIAVDYGQTFDTAVGMTLEDGHAQVLDSKTCATPADPTRFSLTWTIADPQIVAVLPADCAQLVDAPACERHEFFQVKGVGVGSTTVHVAVTDTHTGDVVGQQDFPM